ncbi:MAG: phosphotransferase [Allosphingosinicella sp.]|uniref:phosphotransferase n=1 Tax=Allosphingosinicella sp. TaxID=2823234 RepID=UPI00395BE8B8
MAQDKIERIRRAYERDMREQPKAVRYGDIPISYDAITPEWLTAILCRHVPDAAVTGLRLDVPDSGTSNRRRIFIEYNRAGQEAGLPASVFCKATHDLVNRMLLSTSGTFSEVSFYNRVRPLLDIDSPTAFFAAYDPESWASIIVLPDIAGEVEFCSHETVMTREAVESQLDLLARMHGRFLVGDELQNSLSDLFSFRDRFRLLDRDHDFRSCCDAGFLAAEEVIPVRLFARAAEVWPATVRSVERQAEMPETFTHSDVHLKNWYRRGEARMGISDWQSSGKGSWARDLAYTISTALPIEERRALERDLIGFYLDRLASTGAPVPSFDQTFDDYREQLLSALAWWTMTLTPSKAMPDMQPRDTTMEFLSRIAAAIDDLGTLDRR